LGRTRNGKKGSKIICTTLHHLLKYAPLLRPQLRLGNVRTFSPISSTRAHANYF